MTFVDQYADEGKAPSGDKPRSGQPTFTPSAEHIAQNFEGPRDIGLVFIGDSYVAGYGDPKGLGWVARVAARTYRSDVDVTAYNLGVRGDTSGDVLARWRAECPPRWKGRSERRLVIGVGSNDVHSGMTTARSRLNLANVLDDAAATGIATFVVGPPPTLDTDHNARLEVVVQAQADVCARRQVPYVDCYQPLLGHEQWASDLSRSSAGVPAVSPDRPGQDDDVHPGAAGYGLLAWLVLHGGWDRWLHLTT